MFNKKIKLFFVTLIFMLSISSVAAVEMTSTDDMTIGDAEEEPPSGTIMVDSIDEDQTYSNEVLKASFIENVSNSAILSASDNTNALNGDGAAADEYGNENILLTSKNTVKDTIDAEDFGKRYRSNSNYYATFYDSNGKPLADTNITFIFNNRLYFTSMTDSEGVAMLKITATVGTHTITSVNPVTGQSKTNKITVYNSVRANDLEKRYRSSQTFSATFYGLDEKVYANKEVTFLFNNHLVLRVVTDSNGVARLPITASVGTHTIVSINPVTGQRITNKITVYNSVRANDLEKRYRSSQTFSATFYGLDERVYANKEVTFLFNNHLVLRAVTDSNGVARLPITASVGTHTIVSINPVTDQRITNKITVLPTLLVTKSWTTFSDRNTKLVITLYDDENLAKNADVNVYVNGVKYQVKTDSNGVAYYTFKLSKGTYEFKSQDSKTGYVATTDIKVLNPTISAANMDAAVNTDSTYTATLLNPDGTVCSNTDMQITLNGKTSTVKTNSKGVAFLSFNLAKGTYAVTCKDLNTGYTISRTITVSLTETKLTSSAPVTYNKYGVSSDGKTILAIGRASASGEYSKYGYTFYVTEFERTCSCCGGHNLYWGIFWAGNEYTNYATFPGTGLKEGSSAEGAIFCADCDSDWSVFGHNHGGSGGDLTVVTKTAASTKAAAYELKSGNYVKS